MPYLGKQPVNLIKDNAVSTNKIADDAVTNAKLSNNAVNSTEIVDNAITTDKINGSAVTDAKLANDAVTTNKINNLAVEQGKIADQAINEAKLQVSNAPVNDYVLTAQSGNTGGLTWASPSVLKNWAIVSEFTEANGNPLSNATELVFDVVPNKRYVIEADIYSANATTSSATYFACEFSDVNNSTFNINTIYSRIGRSGQAALYQGSQGGASTTGILTNPTSDPIGTLNSTSGEGPYGVHGTWQYFQHNTTNNSLTRTSHPAMWGMYHNYAAGTYTVQTTYLTVNGTLGTNVDKVRLFLSTQNMSGDIRILRRD
tara:strand:+ start:30096 stop:31040 length:945 start_codon:yes stop_codon:yes gene_type:complete